MGQIIVVEDDTNTRLGLVEILRLEGHKVSSAENAKVALRQIKCQKFDVLLTDLRLPGMSGLDLVSHVTAISPETRSIIMTAFSTPADKRASIRLGVFAYLSKPLNLESLFHYLRRATRGDSSLQHKPFQSGIINQSV